MTKTITILLLLIACSFNAQSQEAFHDLKFVDTWSGSEKDLQRPGLEKHWIMHRFAEGTFILLFTAVEDGEVTTFAEKGKWGNEKDEFHELHFESGITDIYNYTFLDDYHIQFKSKVLFNKKNNTYQFIDTKLIDN